MLAVPPRFEARARPITTARLLLTPLDGTDTRDFADAVDASRSHLEPWLPWVPFTVDADSAARYTEASAADWDASRACRFAVRERSTRRLVGIAGLEAIVHLHAATELGYWLARDVTGRGLMTEAARAVVEFAFQVVRAHRVRVAAATTNHASLAVIRRLGFHFEGVAREAERCQGRWLDHAIFSLLATDARPRL